MITRSSHKLINLVTVLALLFTALFMVTPALASSTNLKFDGTTGLTPNNGIKAFEQTGATVSVSFGVQNALAVSSAGEYRISYRPTLVGAYTVYGTWAYTFSAGLSAITRNIVVPALADGQYDLKVEARLTTEASYPLWAETTNLIAPDWFAPVPLVDPGIAALVVDNTPPTVLLGALTAPSTGVVWSAGVNITPAQDVTWNTGSIIDANKDLASGIWLEYSLNGGASWVSFPGNWYADASPLTTWTTPYAVSTQARVRLTARDLAGNVSTSGSSSGDFTLADATPPAITTPWLPAAGTTLVGTIQFSVGAISASGIASVVWEYNDPVTGWGVVCNGAQDASLLWKCNWDTTTVADDLGLGNNVRMTITSNSGLFTGPLLRNYVIKNTYQLGGAPGLKMGWNLISAQAIPNDESITTMLSDLIANNSLVSASAWIYNTITGQLEEKRFIPGVVNELTTIDDGLAYWLNLNVDDVQLFDGRDQPEPPAPPPAYPVYAGWNYYGYKSTVDGTTVQNYIGTDLVNKQQGAMYTFDNVNKVYLLVTLGTGMVRGNGYLMALSDSGYIYP